jgi:hypothetical protein
MKSFRFLIPAIVSCFIAIGYVPQAFADDFEVSPAISTNLVGDIVRLMTLQNGIPADPSLGFQWAFNGTNVVDDGRIIGSELRELVISNAGIADAGVYTVTVLSNNAPVAVASATVNVLAEPEIVSVVSQTSGADVTFQVIATGGLLAFQWLWQGQPLAGATTSTLHFSDALTSANAGYYSVMVTNFLGTNFSEPTALLFTKPAPTGVYQGIYALDGGASPEGSGYFQFTISATKRSFSGKVSSGKTVVRESGTFSLAHEADITLPGPGGALVAAHVQLLTTNDTPQIIGLSTNGTTNIFLIGNRLYYNSKLTNSLAGKYTLSLQNTNLSPLVPNGDGYATIRISRSGTVAISGQTADGSKFSQSCGLSRLGDFPLYASLNGARGRLLGMQRLKKQTSSSILGPGSIWVKDPGPDTLYPDGFYLILNGIGSTFVSPASQPIFAWTNGVISFHAGDLFTGDVAIWDFVPVALRPPARFVPDRSTENVNVSASAGNGAVSGSFRDPITDLKAQIRGVVLQQQKTARGFFISTNSAGAFGMDSK